jgi:hypothetical protein
MLERACSAKGESEGWLSHLVNACYVLQPEVERHVFVSTSDVFMS